MYYFIYTRFITTFDPITYAYRTIIIDDTSILIHKSSCSLNLDLEQWQINASRDKIANSNDNRITKSFLERYEYFIF